MCLFAALAALPVAPAALLLDPAGGVVVSSATVGPADKDDGAFAGGYVFFGTPYFGSGLSNPAPTVSLNGHILFGSGDGSGDSFLRPLGVTGFTRIAPMWHDFKIGTSGEVIEHADPSFRYYGVTWNNMESVLHDGQFATFQAIFFESTTTIQGNTFLAGDIAFSYGDLGFYDVSEDAVVGLENGSAFATLDDFLPTDGAASTAYYGDFPVGVNEYVLFRPDGTGNYNVSILPIPEPGVAVLSAVGALALFRRRRSS